VPRTSRRIPRLLLFGLGVALTATAARGQTEAESLSASFRKAAKRVLPSVVTVRPVGPMAAVEPAEPTVPDAPALPHLIVPGFPPPQAVPPRERGGSGLVIDAAKGLVLTNLHVVDGAARAVVILPGGKERPVKAIRSDPKSDLALLSIDPAGLVQAAWGDSEKLDVGDWVLAVGQPFGLSDTVTAGIVSGKGRGVGLALYEDLIQTDAAINPGNSGGPLVNMKGEVVGINTALKTVGGGYEGVGFAVPASRARRVAGDLAEFGQVRRSYLGVTVRRADPASLDRLDVPSAIVIAGIAPQSPAASADLRPGDILLKVDGHPVLGPGPLQAMIEVAQVGKPLTLTIDRDNRLRDVKVVPRSQPDRFGLPDASAVPTPNRDAAR
jgi:serine protease Do